MELKNFQSFFTFIYFFDVKLERAHTQGYRQWENKIKLYILLYGRRVHVQRGEKNEKIVRTVHLRTYTEQHHRMMAPISTLLGTLFWDISRVLYMTLHVK